MRPLLVLAACLVGTVAVSAPAPQLRPLPPLPKLPRTFAGHSQSVRSVAFSPDGKTIASSSDDGTIKLWDVATGKNTATLSRPGGNVYSLTFIRDDKTLASSSNKMIESWDVATGKAAGTLTEHTSDIWAVAFSPDGRMVASGGRDMTVRVVAVPTK